MRLVLEMLREGGDRSGILQNIAKYCKVTHSQIDNYIAEAKQLLTAERAEIQAIAKKERQERELAALSKIPTPSEIMLGLLSELDLKSPVPTGFELKILNNEPTNVQRFASESHRQFILKALLAFSLEMAKVAEPEADDDELTPLTNEQLKNIAEIINK
ncbi:MAG: hypothetical protein KBF86_14325 [Chitinophagales bacterium]|nr:hypothetical protein [Chitinophagales bacterium]